MSGTRSPAYTRAHIDRDVAYLAYHDALTGLPNRTLLQEHLEEALERASRRGLAVALVYIDLDDFKAVNDSLGHAAGDELLVKVAERLRPLARPSDVISRQGGDEFLCLASDIVPPADGRSVAQFVAEGAWRELRRALDEPFEVGDAVFRIEASLGVSVFPDDAGDPETLHKHADAAMYRAKHAGGGFAVYEPDAADPLAPLSQAARLREALATGELELYYQPVWELSSGRMRGVESLIRWRHPTDGLIPPAAFIPVAERTGLVDAVGDWVLAAAVEQLRAWRDAGLAPRLSLNVSPRQLRRPSFADDFIAPIRAAGLDPRSFIVELTESIWALETARLMPVVERLRDAGVGLALDDFGAGYSSLARLRALPADIIKIDRAFLEGIPDDPQATAIVAAILALADACGRDVVAEGIETEAQLRFLREHGCALGQGYHLCRPGPAEEITPALAEHLLDHRRL